MPIVLRVHNMNFSHVPCHKGLHEVTTYRIYLIVMSYHIILYVAYVIVV